MNRRAFAKGLLAAPAMPVAAQQEAARKTTGLPPLTIKDVKVITTSGGARYRWVFLKIITSEPGLYGIGSASNHYQTHAVIAALEKHLVPWLIGKDPDQIEDLWQSSHLKTYWRNGPVNNNVLSAMDMALWDIKGKRAGMPVYELLGGKVRDAVPCYDHVAGNDAAAAIDAVQKSHGEGLRIHPHSVRRLRRRWVHSRRVRESGRRAVATWPGFDEELYVERRAEDVRAGARKDRHGAEAMP